MTLPIQDDEGSLDSPLSADTMSLVDHLQELRRRIIICLVSIAITSTVSYFFAEELIKVIAAPAGKLYFIMPLFILVFTKLGIISSSFLTKKRKVVSVLAFVVGAIVSPTPDVFSQTMIAIPIILLYEISILLVKHGL